MCWKHLSREAPVNPPPTRGRISQRCTFLSTFYLYSCLPLARLASNFPRQCGFYKSIISFNGTKKYKYFPCLYLISVASYLFNPILSTAFDFFYFFFKWKTIYTSVYTFPKLYFAFPTALSLPGILHHIVLNIKNKFEDSHFYRIVYFSIC